MTDKKIALLASRLVEMQNMFACAESCTGGLLAKVCTDRAGSSAWFDRGFVTYSNLSKHEMLGVDSALLVQYGAVSAETVIAMATGVIAHSQAGYAVSISGIAGPEGGSDEKPVGTVFFGFANRDGEVFSKQHGFSGDRASVRTQSVVFALRELLLWIN